MSITKITPILVVESVDQNLPFWQNQLGYKVTVSVPHGAATGFVILAREGSEMMLQSIDCVTDDLKLPTIKVGDVLLYADTDSLDKTMQQNKDAQIVIHKRKTGYGATEVWVRTPAGQIMGFSEFTK